MQRLLKFTLLSESIPLICLSYLSSSSTLSLVSLSTEVKPLPYTVELLGGQIEEVEGCRLLILIKGLSILLVWALGAPFDGAPRVDPQSCTIGGGGEF